MNPPQLNSVLPDSNIWCSQTLHSWFGLLVAETRGQWSFYYTDDIIAEAQRSLRRRYFDLNSTQIENIRDRLITVGVIRITAFAIDKKVTYPDEFDAHVHSAAVHQNVGIIVTNNAKDFEGIYNNPADCPYELHTADEFLMLVAESAPFVMDQVIRQQFSYWSGKKKPFSLPEKLEKAGCGIFAEWVRRRMQQIDL